MEIVLSKPDLSQPRPTRRTFLGQALAGSTVIALGSLAVARAAPRASAQQGGVTGPRLRILILGGTGFLGPKTVEAALARGHHVTVFNRGRTEKRIPFGFEGVEHLYGNRYPDLPADDERGPDGKLLRPDATPKGLEQLAGKSWDVVIDNSGYYLRQVKSSAELLAKSCKRYLYISSISAYADNKTAGANEDHPLAPLADPNVETMGPNFSFYGGLKAVCEQAAQAAFAGRCAVVRPGYIVGPGDPTDRFSYWPVRFARGGACAAPGSPSDPLQWIDVRDLAEFLVKLAEDQTTGVFNAVGPAKPGTIGAVIDGCAKLATPPCDVTWLPNEFLEKNGAGGEDGLFPIWVHPGPDYVGYHTWDNDRAEQAGLRFRPLDDTLKAIVAWWPTEVERRTRVTAQLIDDAKKAGREPPKLPPPDQLKQGPNAAKEAELIAARKAELAAGK